MAPSATDVTGTNQTIESPSRSTRSSRLALARIRLQRLNHIDGSEHVTRLTNQLRGALPFKQRQLGPHSVAGHRRMSGQETSSTTSHGSTKQRQSRNFTPRSAPTPTPTPSLPAVELRETHGRPTLGRTIPRFDLLLWAFGMLAAAGSKPRTMCRSKSGRNSRPTDATRERHRDQHLATSAALFRLALAEQVLCSPLHAQTHTDVHT